RRLRVYSMTMDETREFDLSSPPAAAAGDWSDYILGVALMLEKDGRRLSGADLVVWTDVPIGAGLSSSAALEVSCAHALLIAAGLPFEPIETAKTCQRAENDFVGMRCGVMDQYISCRGVAGHALLIDCRSLGSRNVAIAPNLRILVANSAVRHQHAGGEYNARRDVTPDELEASRRKLPDLIYRRCRHIVTENARVLEAERALKAGGFAACGRAMNLSHISMRYDFEITCPEVDTLVGLAQTVEGVYGSRMTGGGFGGCTVSLVEASAVDRATRIMVDGYRAATGLEAEIFACAPSDGVGLIPV